MDPFSHKIERRNKSATYNLCSVVIRKETDDQIAHVYIFVCYPVVAHLQHRQYAGKTNRIS